MVADDDRKTKGEIRVATKKVQIGYPATTPRDTGKSHERGT